MVESSRIRFAYINVGPGCRAIDIGVPVGDNNVKEHRGRDSEDNSLDRLATAVTDSAVVSNVRRDLFRDRSKCRSKVGHFTVEFFT